MPRRERSPDVWAIAPVAPADLPGARELLRLAALPVEGLEDQFAEGFVSACEGPRLIGLAGLESHGSRGLLRSVAVVPERRGRGLGEALVRDRLARARAVGLASVHLLTTTAPGFFERLGFRVVERTAVPPEIRGTAEFAGICPETAVVMALPFAP